jgi:GT2 family glycosyltransferase
VTWNGADLLPACLDAVLPEGAPVLVVDNASQDGTASLLAERYPMVRVITLSTNTGFAGGVARALADVDTPYVVVLNNDAEVRPGWLAALLAPLEADPEVAAVCSKLLLPDGRLNSAGGYVEPDGYAHDRGFGAADDGRLDEAQDVAFATGTAAAFRTAAVREVGGVDPRFFLYYEDVELSWRLWLAGWRVRYEPTAVVVHQHSATAGAGSPLHTFHTERNRLATLAVCAPMGVLLRALGRYPLTTLSVAVGESRPKALVRLRALVSFLRWLPALLQRRRALRPKVPRSQVHQQFCEQAAVVRAAGHGWG